MSEPITCHNRCPLPFSYCSHYTLPINQIMGDSMPDHLSPGEAPNCEGAGLCWLGHESGDFNPFLKANFSPANWPPLCDARTLEGISFIFIFRAAPAACGGSQARGRFRTIAASLRHSHSNAGSEPCLQPTPWLTATPVP